MAEKKTCVWHCQGCQGHFHSIASFDFHRSGDYCSNPETVATKDGKLLLQMYTDEGFCDLTTGCWSDGKRVKYISPVTIWQTVSNPSGWSSGGKEPSD